jgi:hypothetical protein
VAAQAQMRSECVIERVKIEGGIFQSAQVEEIAS